MDQETLLRDGVEIIQDKYGSLSKECIKDFLACLKAVQYDRGETIVKAGQYSDKLFFLMSGSARAYYLKEGKEITDWFAFEHEFISAINSFFLNIPSPHYINAEEPMTAGFIKAGDMERLNDRYHDFEHMSRIITTEVMLKLQRRIVALQFQSAQQKYEELLSEYPDITNRVALGHIASYLGITLETLSRIRNGRRTNLT